MTSSKNKNKENLILVAATISTMFLLTLSAISIHLLISNANEVKEEQKVKVLGASKQNEEKSFWVSFLTDNPYYYPGWKRLNEISHEINDVNLQEQSKNELEKLKPIEE